jgi:hypothetical protein
VKDMLARIIVVSFVTATMLLVILLQTTTPSTIGPLGILIVFILMYVSVLGVLTFLLFWGSRSLARLSRGMVTRRPVQPLGLGRAYYFSSVLALAPVMFVGMQSVGQVSVSDVFLIVLFTTMTCVYIAKRTS